MIDSNGKIVQSIPSNCINYTPNDKKLNVACAKLGDLYECKNFKSNNKDSIVGCVFCANQKSKNNENRY